MFSKGLLGVLGLGGIGATAYGTLSSFGAFQKWDRELVDVKPILLCNDGIDKYEVFLTLAGEGKKELGGGVSLEVKKTSNEGNDAELIPWGEQLIKRRDWLKELKIGIRYR